MVPVPSLVALFAAALCIVALQPALAQPLSESTVVYEAARNKIGLIRYCRDKGLLTPGIADQAVSAMESAFDKAGAIDAVARDLGERAQKAGEAGFWETGRRRDVADVARQFRTTPASLCQDWAGETLRRNAATVPVIIRGQPIQPAPQARQDADPAPDYKPPVRNAVSVKPAPVRPAPASAPEKAPVTPVRAEPNAPPRAAPLAVPPNAAGKALPLPTNGMQGRTTNVAAPNLIVPILPRDGGTLPPPREAPPTPYGRQSAEAHEPPLDDPDTTAAMPRDLDEGPSPPIWGKWPFNKLVTPSGKRGRCLMPGCKW